MATVQLLLAGGAPWLFLIASSGPQRSLTRPRRCGPRSPRPGAWAPGSATRRRSTCARAGGPDEAERGRDHSRDAGGTGGGAGGVRVHLGHLRAARGRSASDPCRVRARAGRRGHAADCGPNGVRAAARGLPRKAYDGNTGGWAKELGELVAYLDAG